MRENQMKICEYYYPKKKKCMLFNNSMCWEGFIFNKDGTCDAPFKINDTCGHYKPRIKIPVNMNIGPITTIFFIVIAIIIVIAVFWQNAHYILML